jgi:hypothetical protein
VVPARPLLVVRNVAGDLRLQARQHVERAVRAARRRLRRWRPLRIRQRQVAAVLQRQLLRLLWRRLDPGPRLLQRLAVAVLRKVRQR